MTERPLIAVPHWRAPTWERTKYYYDALEAAGARYAIVEGELPAEARGLLLTGGVDVDPRLYGEKRGPLTDRPNKKRDEHELRLLRQALDRDLAVLCICRGHELLNVALGGSLVQHIEGDGHRWHDDGSSNWHQVSIDGGGHLAEVYGRGAELRVNSRHHQGVSEDRLAPSLRVTAHSVDGFVEAMESTEHRWVVGVQWHPERPEMNGSAPALWQAFIEATVPRR
jgi:gamma-glutamyl-gamma-aminobutyrate hydrolase PuuD